MQEYRRSPNSSASDRWSVFAKLDSRKERASQLTSREVLEFTPVASGPHLQNTYREATLLRAFGLSLVEFLVNPCLRTIVVLKVLTVLIERDPNVGVAAKLNQAEFLLHWVA